MEVRLVWLCAVQVLRGGQLCAAADIYSFGITCYEVLTGQQAFR